MAFKLINYERSKIESYEQYNCRIGKEQKRLRIIAFIIGVLVLNGINITVSNSFSEIVFSNIIFGVISIGFGIYLTVTHRIKG